MLPTSTGGGIDYGDSGNELLHLVIFPAGTTCASFEIPINDDELSEHNETFNVAIVSMSLPFGVILGDEREAEVTITDNDSEWQFVTTRVSLIAMVDYRHKL